MKPCFGYQLSDQGLVILIIVIVVLFVLKFIFED